ncbi:MAG: hypothetical protein OIF50_17485 [Flavobacteriaceae bacterium]|nr:hypothetical protein [Flavobacteriaceae bacterium]
MLKILLKFVLTVLAWLSYFLGWSQQQATLAWEADLQYYQKEITQKHIHIFHRTRKACLSAV